MGKGADSRAVWWEVGRDANRQSAPLLDWSPGGCWFDLWGFLPQWIFPLLDTLSSLGSRTRLSLLVLLPLASSFSLVSFAGFSSPPQPRNVTASQIPVLGPLLFPISPPQWWFIQGHACWSPVSSFDPASKLQSPLSNCLLENPTGWLVDQSTHHTEPLTFCPLKLVSPSSPHPRKYNSSLLVVQRLKTYKVFLISLFF